MASSIRSSAKWSRELQYCRPCPAAAKADVAATTQVWASITRTLGSSVWQHTIIALSHGRMKALPAGLDSYGALACAILTRGANSLASAYAPAAAILTPESLDLAGMRLC